MNKISSNTDDSLNITMNVNTSMSGDYKFNTKINKKKEKKEKYLERKMLQNKRKREKVTRNKDNVENDAKDHNKPNNEKRDEIIDQSQHKESNKRVKNKENINSESKNIENPKLETNTYPKQPTEEMEGDHVIDELNEFYNKKENKKIFNTGINDLNPLSNADKKKKKKELENQIKEEYKEIKEEKENLEIKLKEKHHTVFSIKNFEDLEINKYLKKVLSKNNFTQMTKVQKKAIPILIQHKNVVVKSETGSGKTLAYVIPLYENLCKINEINKIDRKDGVYSIIFAPTHELCLQIEETFNKLKSACISVVYGTLMGGQKIEREKQKLRKGLNVIISTPGRLLYHLKNTKNIKFDKLKILIFDEGDRLLDMGFEKDIKECLSLITNKNDIQNENSLMDSTTLNSDCFKKLKIYLISATIDNRIRKLVEYLMKGFKTVGFDLKTEDEEYQAPAGLNQFYSTIYDEFRLIHLIAFLRSNLDKKIMIFVSTCDLVNFLHDLFLNIEIDIKNSTDSIAEKKFDRERNNRNNRRSNSQAPQNSYSQNKQNSEGKLAKLLNTNIYKLHGKMDHNQRKEIFKEFNIDKPGIMISTDVASRGLDFPMVDWIIHYDVNPDPKEYLNRMGRTARLDQTGNSLIFLMKHEVPILDSCLKNFQKNMSELNSGKILLEFVNKINSDLMEQKIKIEPEPYKDEVDENEKFRKKYFFSINPLQRCIKTYLFKSKDNLILARKAFKSSIRSYVTFMRFQKDVFNARSFGLYKESTKIKVGDQEMHVDYQFEKNKIKGERKFTNKKIHRKLLISEFDN